MFDRNFKKFKARLKTKRASSFLYLILLILGISLVVWLFLGSQSHLSALVSKTHQHIRNINSRLQSIGNEAGGGSPGGIDETAVDSAGSSSSLSSASLNNPSDSIYLELLGFVPEPKLFKEDEPPNRLESVVNLNSDSLLDQLNNMNLVPIVTALFRFSDREQALIESKIKYYQNDLMLVYDLDLSSSEQLKLKKICNSSCILKPFKGDKYPKHLSNPRMRAYKPIIIQEVLNEYGAIIWIEPPNVFTSNKIDKYLTHARHTSGLLSWPLRHPITQLTHPTMFKYFDSPVSNFYFAHILDTSQLIIYNKREIHEHLMLPWVKCALREHCIAPPGSKYYGCDFTRRPIFHYSGCHRYEMSAFSIITAKLFEFQVNKYTAVVGERVDDGAFNNNTVFRKEDKFFVNLVVLAKEKSEAPDEEHDKYAPGLTTKNLL